MQRPLLILVSGPPASGKTTLSRRLVADLTLPLVARDDFKEVLYETLGWSTVEWSQKLGRASYELMYLAMEKLLAAGVSHIVDCNFDPTYATARLLDFAQRYSFEPFQILCTAPAELILQRYVARIDAGERHPGHVDRLRTGEFDPAANERRYVPMALGGDSITIDTSDFADVQYEALLVRIHSYGLLPKP